MKSGRGKPHKIVTDESSGTPHDRTFFFSLSDYTAHSCYPKTAYLTVLSRVGTVDSKRCDLPGLWSPSRTSGGVCGSNRSHPCLSSSCIFNKFAASMWPKCPQKIQNKLCISNFGNKTINATKSGLFVKLKCHLTGSRLNNPKKILIGKRWWWGKAPSFKSQGRPQVSWRFGQVFGFWQGCTVTAAGNMCKDGETMSSTLHMQL